MPNEPRRMHPGALRTWFLAAVLCLASVDTASSQNSLQVFNPQQGWLTQQGTIEEAVVSVHPKGAYLEYGVYLTFSARGAGFTSVEQLEIEFFFDLPEGAIVTDSWLWVGDDIMRALIFDRWTASGIYEGIVNRRRDPSILFKRSETRHELRVYPLLGGETRKVKLTYLVPANLIGGSAQAALPLDLLESSRFPVDELEVLGWSDGDWSAPSIVGSVEGSTFELRDQQTSTPHYYRLIKGADLSSVGVLSIAVPIPFRNGVFFQATEGESGYYQLILKPETLLPNDVGPRRVSVLIDHDQANTSASAVAVAEAARGALHSTLREGDYFNLFVSQLEVRQYADSWTAVTPQSIDDAFLTIGPPAEYSSLPSLLQKAVSFGKTQGEPHRVVLVASSDAFSTSTVADRLLDDLGFSDYQGTVQVVDYQDRNTGQYRVGGIWYEGNGYLYTRMAQTGGQLTQLQVAGELGAILPQVLGAGPRQLHSIDLVADLNAGYTFDRISNLEPGQHRSLADPIVQTGQFVGNPPYQVSFSGINLQDAFSIDIDLAPEWVVPATDAVRQTWVGQRIQELEGATQSNDTIAEVIGLSLEHRVLSEYTAFLALEPSDTTMACPECQDETELTSVEYLEELPTADSLMQVYPNPVGERATLKVSIPEQLRGEETSLVLYDILGRAVRVFPLDQLAAHSSLSWDRTSDSGERVASGVYVLALRIGARVRSVNVVAH